MRLLLGAIVVLTLVSGPALVASADSLGTKLDDTTITTKVKAKLTTDSVKTLVKVHVDTQNGVVHLQGTVPSEADKAEAERLARSTDGVKDVMNDLTIGGTISSPSASPASK